MPPLRQAIDRYGIQVNYRYDLKAIDGPARSAVFTAHGPDGETREVVHHFDMIHVTPPQSAPDFIKRSPLAAASGWVDVDPATLRHTRYANVFSLGDACSAPNTKTAAAVRMQAPVVTRNVLATLAGQPLPASYDGYGSCPLTVELGKIVLAEFAYGGKVTPSFPVDPRRPRRAAWLLKTRFMPFLYWNIMLKGRQFDFGHREREFADAA
ncbi:MAG TPA: FAD/NAD(P)-binding oxidoreductase [Rhodopila sp.]|nr:FAD/NAD(P)-binding oxidoreductase [Rhodopila sp.]